VAADSPLPGEPPEVGVEITEDLASYVCPVIVAQPLIIGLSRLITARAVCPRRARSSVRSRSRIRLMAALLGLISSLPPYRRTLNPRKSKPSVRETTRVLSPLNARPLGASHAASRALTSTACCLVWQRATKSSAYLIRTGEPVMTFPALLPVWW
jgi:hypothetical protein